MPKIERCLAQLTEEQIWSRTNDASNSIGNLLLHLTGSSRYWAAEVIGARPSDASASASSTSAIGFRATGCWRTFVRR